MRFLIGISISILHRPCIECKGGREAKPKPGTLFPNVLTTSLLERLQKH